MNADIFANFICLNFNCVDIGEFPHVFKHADIMPVHKKQEKVIKLVTDLSAHYQTFLKSTKN